MAKKKNNEITIRSSAAEYLTYVAAAGDDPQSVFLPLSKTSFTGRFMVRLPQNLFLPALMPKKNIWG